MNEHRIIYPKHPVKITICKSCGDHTYLGRWRRDPSERNLNNDLKKLIIRSIRVERGKLISINVPYVNSEDLMKKDKGILVDALVYIDFFDVENAFKIFIPMDIDVKLCDRCIKEKIENYDAILQVRWARGVGEELRSEIYKLIYEVLERAYYRGGDYRIIKTEDRPYGMDVYFSSLSQAWEAARMISKKYSTTIKKTMKLIKIDRSGKRVSRHTLLVRIP